MVSITVAFTSIRIFIVLCLSYSACPKNPLIISLQLNGLSEKPHSNKVKFDI
jgi:hypothetical protein